MVVKDGLTASQRLPYELVLPICVLAAENDRRCANTMAFVSKEICICTANARWSTIAITSIRQLFAFFKVVHGVSDELHDRCMLDWSEHYLDVRPANLGYTPRSIEQLASAPLEGSSVQKRSKGLSLPQEGDLYTYVRHLFIDFDRGDAGAFDGLVTSLEWMREHYKNTFKYLRSAWGPIILQDPLEDDRLGSSGMDLNNAKFGLKHLSLGPGSYAFLRSAGRFFDYEELTIFYHRSERGEDVGTGYDVNAGVITFGSPPEPISGMLGFTTHTLKRLHLLDENVIDRVDARHQPPWKLLAHLNKDTVHLTHLRYDAAEPILDPCKFADKLRPVLEEPTIHQDAVAAETEWYGGSLIEASNYHLPLQYSFAPVQYLAKFDDFQSIFARALRDGIGAGHLEYLQFAWKSGKSKKQRQGEEAADVRTHVDESTSSISGSCESSLALSLKESIQSYYGWDAPGIESAFDFVARKYSLSEEQRKNLDNHAFSPQEAVHNYQKIKNGFDMEARAALQQIRGEVTRMAMKEIPHFISPFYQYGIRAPKSLVELGEGNRKLTYTKKARLALFEERARGGRGAWPA